MPDSEPLVELLRNCTVRVNAPAAHGTGFFVAPGLILTCAHVIQSAEELPSRLTVYCGDDRKILPVRKIRKVLRAPFPDLAQLEVDREDHPCVYLDKRIKIGAELYAYGYSQNYDEGDSVTLVYEGPTEMGADQRLLKLSGGQVEPGFSGSPILNLKTGYVCGILKRTRDESSDLGGRAVSVEVVLGQFSDLGPLNRSYHRSDARWTSARKKWIESNRVRLWAVMAVIVAIIAIGVGVAFAAFNQLPPMPDGFNVAVAEFVEQDANGVLSVTKDSRAVSDWLFAGIERESKLLPSSFGFHIRGPDQIGAIYGADDQERADNANWVANRHKATILIYGIITNHNGKYQVQPNFVVNNQGFDYGSEVTGPNRLGKPVDYVPPLSQPVTKSKVNEKLNARRSALQHLIQGLAYYYLSDYESALTEFTHATDDRNWAPEEGQEVVYLLIGAAQLRMYNSKAPLEQRMKVLKDASDSFDKAHRLNSNYARSYLGLGSVALEQAILNPDSVDVRQLVTANDWYSKAMTSTEPPSSAHVPLKAAYGLGQINLLGYKNQLPGWSADQARSYFDQVIVGYEADPSPDLTRSAGSAYCQLGYLAGLEKSDWVTMSASCRKAIEVLKSMPVPPLDWIARYWSWIGQAEQNNQNIEAAKSAYNEAIRIGEELIGPPQQPIDAGELARWHAALDRLDKSSP